MRILLYKVVAFRASNYSIGCAFSMHSNYDFQCIGTFIILQYYCWRQQG